MVSNTATNFENSKHRRIYQGTRGGFFIRRQKKSGGDEKVYDPVAKFRTNADGHSSKITNENRMNVPNGIRPAVRKVRKNKGVMRGPKANGRGGLNAMVHRHPSNVPNMIVNEVKEVVMNLNNNNNRGMGGLVAVGPSPNNVMRKRRSNLGKRHARPSGLYNLPTILPANVMAPRVRKTRSNKGKKRGPRKA